MRLYLHQVRKELGMTVQDLAKESGYHRNTINAWERGYIAPNAVELIEWTQVLGYRVAVVPITPKKRTPSQRLQLKLELEKQ